MEKPEIQLRRLGANRVEIRDDGDGRWQLWTTYTLHSDGSVCVEDVVEDDDWAGYGSSQEIVRREVPLAECPACVREAFGDAA